MKWLIADRCSDKTITVLLLLREASLVCDELDQSVMIAYEYLRVLITRSIFKSHELIIELLYLLAAHVLPGMGSFRLHLPLLALLSELRGRAGSNTRLCWLVENVIISLFSQGRLGRDGMPVHKSTGTLSQLLDVRSVHQELMCQGATFMFRSLIRSGASDIFEKDVFSVFAFDLHITLFVLPRHIFAAAPFETALGSLCGLIEEFTTLSNSIAATSEMSCTQLVIMKSFVAHVLKCTGKYRQASSFVPEFLGHVIKIHASAAQASFDTKESSLQLAKFLARRLTTDQLHDLLKTATTHPINSVSDTATGKSARLTQLTEVVRIDRSIALNVGKVCSRASLGSEERLMEGIDLNRNIWVLDMRSRCISALHRGALESDHALSVVTVFEITIYLIHVHRVSLRPHVLTNFLHVAMRTLGSPGVRGEARLALIDVLLAGGGLDIESHNSVFKSDVSCHLLVSRLVPSRSAVSLLEWLLDDQIDHYRHKVPSPTSNSVLFECYLFHQ